jgi:hypothetical protein
MLEVGKLYSCSEYFLILFPDKETAAAAAAERPAAAVRVHAAYWTRKLGKPVSYCNPETPLLVLNAYNHYAEVLAGDKVGWIIYQDWLNIGEIISKAS